MLRARESAAIALPNGSWNTCHALAPRQPKVHDILFLAYSDKSPIATRVDGLFTDYPDLLKIEMAQISQAVGMALHFIEPGELALLISHKPLVDLARRHFRPNDFKETELAQGEAYQFIFNDDDACVGVLHLALPSN